MPGRGHELAAGGLRDRAGALGAGLWWYERSRPPAKLVALVGALAALAALGRDAFAAIPDVKPITAIVLVTGVAFGAAPGFATGALGALASNVLLGEGPWTPWQMLGWGLVGLLGAALGALAGRRLSPLVIALACAACGRGLQPAARLLHLDRDRLPHARRLRRRARLGAGLRRHPRGGQLRLRPGLRRGPAEDAAAGAGAHARHLERPGDRRAAGCRGRVPALGGSGGRALAAASAPRPARCSDSSAGARASGYLDAPRTPTAASAAPPGSRAASSTRPGRRSAWRPPAAGPQLRATAIRCSTRYAPAPARCRAPATSSARSSRWAPAAPRSDSLRGRRPDGGCSRDHAQRRLLRAPHLNLTGSGSSPCAPRGWPRLAPVRAAARMAGGTSRTRRWLRLHRTTAAGGASDVDDTGAAIQALVDGRVRAAVVRAEGYLVGAQNPTAAFPQQPGGAPTRSPRRGRSRVSIAAATNVRPACVAAAASRRWNISKACGLGQRALLANQRSDAGVGDGAGAGGARPASAAGGAPAREPPPAAHHAAAHTTAAGTPRPRAAHTRGAGRSHPGRRTHPALAPRREPSKPPRPARPPGRWGHWRR